MKRVLKLSKVQNSFLKCVIQQWHVLALRGAGVNSITLEIRLTSCELLYTLLTCVYILCSGSTGLSLPNTHSFWPPPSLYPVSVFIAWGPLIPRTGCEVLGVCTQRRWGRAGRCNGMHQAWSNIWVSGCRVASADPYCLSTGHISKARFGFSAASPVSGHEGWGLWP